MLGKVPVKSSGYPASVGLTRVNQHRQTRPNHDRTASGSASFEGQGSGPFFFKFFVDYLCSFAKVPPLVERDSPFEEQDQAERLENYV